jgi:Fe-S-cluster containining protein
MANACGNCNMCCKLPDVPELRKPANQWCSHCDIGKGCRIYESRPAPCRNFQCLWLESQREKQPLPAELRPDRTRMMLTFAQNRQDVLGFCDAADAWKKPAMLRLLRVLASQGHRVMFSAGRDHFALDKDRVRAVELAEPDAQGVRAFVRFLD